MKRSNRKLFLIYTVLFIFVAGICYFSYYSQGKSLVFEGDGYSQHLKALIYYSDYLKDFFKNLFINHEFILPQWDFSIGEGSDILGVFNYYVIGDPIAFLSVLVPRNLIYIYYNFSIILRIYLSGLCFAYLCLQFKQKNNVAILAGMFVYAFCFWNLYNSVRHIYFLNPMIYFPLVIVGVEKVINKDKPYLMSIFVALSAFSNFYFFTNIVVMTVIYVIVRLLCKYKKDIRSIVDCVFRLLAYSLIGVMISGIILVPVIFFYLADGRVGLDVGKHLIYPIYYYLKLPSTFLSTTRNYWLCMGFACPTIFGLLLALKDFKKNKEIAILLIISFIIILFPIFGQLFNAMSYISNKWCFGFSLLVAYVFVDKWDSIKENKLFLIISFLVIGIVCIAFAGISVAVAIIIGLLFLLISLFGAKYVKNINVINFLLVLLVILNIGFVANWQFSSIGLGYNKTATTFEENTNILNESEAKFIAENIKDDEFYRYSGSSLTSNASILFDTHSTDYYWSLTNPYSAQFREDIELDEYSLFKYFEYGKRSNLYILANVKYYVSKDQNTIDDFEYKNSDGEYYLFENESPLSFGYTYSSSLSEESWNSLNPVDKEYSLLDNVVLEDATNINTELYSTQLDYSIEKTDSIKISENRIVTSIEGDKLKLIFNNDIEGKLYARITGLYYDDGNSWLSKKTEGAGVSFEYNNKARSVFIYSRDNRYYNGRKNFTFYLGDIDKNMNELFVSFSEKGNYEYLDIELYVVNDASSTEKLQELNSEHLEDVNFGVNEITGNINLSQDKYLLLTIPYSEGWKAYVDGEKVEVLRANICYSAIALSKGYHEIKLVYSTPYLRTGTLISTIGLICLTVVIIKRKR